MIITIQVLAFSTTHIITTITCVGSTIGCYVYNIHNLCNAADVI